MFLVYLDESHDQTNYVISALIVHQSEWNEVFNKLKQFRLYLSEHYKIPLTRELHARDFLAGRGWLRPAGKVRRDKDVPRRERHIIFHEFMNVIKELNVRSINVCYPIRKGNAEDQSLDRIFNRVHTFCSKSDEQAIMIFDQGNDKFCRTAYRKKRVYNPIPSAYGAWENGLFHKNIRINNVIADPFFKDSSIDYFIQVVDFIAFTLLKKEDPTPPSWAVSGDVHTAFETYMGNIVVREAHRYDPLGVVRK